MTDRKFRIGAPILEVKNISLRFGGVKAITNISFNILRHEIRAIIGPNGAGKSSMLNCINGIYQPQEGQIFYKGKVLTNITPNSIAEMGISRTFQNLALFKRMSVLDNILVGRKLHTKSNFLQVAFQLPKARKEEEANRAKCEEIIKFLEIEDIKNTPVGKLPYGLQKKVELGRALATEADILLLDEPMAGMNVEEKRDMCRFILKVNDELGTTIVLIEHDMGVVMDISTLAFAWDNATRIRARKHVDEQGVKHYALFGPLFFGSISAFQEKFTVDQDPKEVILDFRESRVADMSAIEALHKLTDRYSQQGKRLTLRHVSPDCQVLLQNAAAVIDVNLDEDPTYKVLSDRMS